MKPIEKTTNPETILIHDITYEHIIVGSSRDEKEPLILSKGYNECSGNLSFKKIKNKSGTANITVGNGYDFNFSYDTPPQMVRRAIEKGYDVEVFEQKDWKQALQWLIDNCE